MSTGFMDLLENEAFSDLDNPTNEDMKEIMELDVDNDLDNALIQEYYNLFAGVHPNILTTVKDLASNSLGKDVINLYNKRLDSLNKRYETEKDLEVLKMIREEISEIYDRIEKESDKQRDWLKKLANGAMGSVAIVGSIAIGIKNKELSKELVEESLKVIKGWKNAKA